MMAEKKQPKNILSQGSNAAEAAEAAETSKTTEATETSKTAETAEATHQFSEQPAGLDKQIDKLENRRSKKEPLRAEGNLFGQRVRVLTEKLLTRSLSGAIYAITVLACLYVGHDATTVLIAATGWVCCSEFFHICRLGGRMPNEPLGLTFAVVFPVLARFGFYGMFSSLLILLILCGAWYVLTPRANLADVAVTCFGPIYTSLAYSTIVMLRSYEPSFSVPWLTLAVMVSVWANDSFAFLIGSKFGKHKMAPRISPHKSWEGFYGGLIGSVLVWVLISTLSPTFHMPIWWGVVAGLFEGIFAVVGDLFESRIKRGVGIKDSGSIMPGHGGLLDRSDSMIFGSVAALLFLNFSFYFLGAFLLV